MIFASTPIAKRFGLRLAIALGELSIESWLELFMEGLGK
jgi:hypothetical protein